MYPLIIWFLTDLFAWFVASVRKDSVSCALMCKAFIMLIERGMLGMIYGMDAICHFRRYADYEPQTISRRNSCFDSKAVALSYLVKRFPIV